MDIPIACSLSDADARSQGEEWRVLLRESVVARERRSPTELFFGLDQNAIRLSELVQLAQREKACCPFFDFALVIDADSLALRVSVPPDGSAILDQFAGLAA